MPSPQRAGARAHPHAGREGRRRGRGGGGPPRLPHRGHHEPGWVGGRLWEWVPSCCQVWEGASPLSCSRDAWEDSQAWQGELRVCNGGLAAFPARPAYIQLPSPLLREPQPRPPCPALPLPSHQAATMARRSCPPRCPTASPPSGCPPSRTGPSCWPSWSRASRVGGPGGGEPVGPLWQLAGVQCCFVTPWGAHKLTAGASPTGLTIRLPYTLRLQMRRPRRWWPPASSSSGASSAPRPRTPRARRCRVSDPAPWAQLRLSGPVRCI